MELTQHQTRVQGYLLEELNPLIGFLDDPDVVEVLVNPDRSLWIDRPGGLVLVGSYDPASVIATLAGIAQKTIGPESPELSVSLPLTARTFTGARVHVMAPPITSPGYVVSIRKLGVRPFRLEADFHKVMPPEALTILRDAVANRVNIVVVGETGSGKTALASALLHEVGSGERILILEDVPEIRLEKHHAVALTTSATHSLADLVRSTLRLRPDRIVVGEVRGPEALAILLAWSSGTSGGVATCHASSGRAALERLELLVTLAGVEQPRRLVAAGVGMVAVLSGRHDNRRLQEIVEVRGLADGDFLTTQIFTSDVR